MPKIRRSYHITTGADITVEDWPHDLSRRTDISGLYQRVAKDTSKVQVEAVIDVHVNDDGKLEFVEQYEQTPEGSSSASVLKELVSYDLLPTTIPPRRLV